MSGASQSNLRVRVVQAAETVLKRNGSVGPLELFQQMGFLQPVHVEEWRKGNEFYHVLDNWIQVGPEKFQKTIEYFQDWTKARGQRPIRASYIRRSPRGIEELRITEAGDPEWERFYRTHYAPGDLPAKKATRLTARLNKATELVVFEKVSEEGACSECGAELTRGQFLFMERHQPLAVPAPIWTDSSFCPQAIPL